MSRIALLIAIVGGATGVMLLPPALSGAQGVRVDHSAFDALLKAHVTNGLVDYDAFARAPEFERYLTMLGGVEPASLGDSERLAYWINSYNAFTIALINRHDERKSIRNINRSLGFLKLKGPWAERIVRANGRVLTLDVVEHGIIRKEFREPRIHFALVCAAIGCPPLRSEAYTGTRLDAQLDDQARTFLLESPTKNRVDVAARTVYLSPIFVEFRDYIKDFGGSKESVGRYVARYFPAGPQRDLLAGGGFKVVVTEYDWALNRLKGGR